MSFNFQWHRWRSAQWWHQIKVKAAQENASINLLIVNLLDTWLKGKIIFDKKNTQC